MAIQCGNIDLSTSGRFASRGKIAGGVTFNIKFTGGFPEDGKAAFQTAADIWSALLTSPVPVEIEANWVSLGPSDSSGRELASTNVWFWCSDQPPAGLSANLWYPTALANKDVGKDVDGTNPDVRSDFNSAVKNWYFGTDGVTPLGQYDFMTVALQQIGHGLGFMGSMTVDSTGVGRFGLKTAGGQTYPAAFDQFVRSANGSLTDGVNFINPSPALATQVQAHNVSLNGPATKNAYGSEAPLLYTPLPWKEGASYVHLDESTYPPGNVNSLMTPFIGWAEPIHNPGPIAMGLLKDLGW